MKSDIFEFLSGKPYILDGISGRFKYETYMARYPYRHRADRLYHVADEVGRESRHYQDTKQKLGDDWDTDLTEDIELYCNAAQELGFDEKEVS